MEAPSILRSTHPAYPNWLWYWWGELKYITGYGNAHIVRNTVQNTGRVCLLPLDLVTATVHDLEPDSQTERNEAGQFKFTRIWPDKYFGSPPVVVTDPPPIEPPDGEPDEPPVDPPPVVPPVVNPTYAIKIEHTTASVSVLVGNWFEPGKAVKLVSPTGNIQTTTTGAKLEHGAGGFEAGYIIVVGDYGLIIDGNEFIIPCDGKFTRVTFERVTGTEPERSVVTGYMGITQARLVLAAANEIARNLTGMDVFRIE
jgi:hypothetical protein